MTPPAHCPPTDPSILFKSASWDGDRLLLCTQTEVLSYDPAAGRIVDIVSHPCFNDLHHVVRLGGRIHVAATGLDAIFVLGADGEIVDTHSALPTGPWDRFDRTIDYRRVPTTKPHRAHPNYVFEAAGCRWITRFEQHDAIRIGDAGPAIVVADAPIHDGLPVGDRVWFTVVSGHVVVADPATGAVVSRHDLNTLRADGNPLGWCRGILVEPDRVLVGFSRWRSSLFKQNLSWLRAPLNRPESLPSRVTAYDLDGNRELASWNLEEAGMNAVFSILPLA